MRKRTYTGSEHEQAHHLPLTLLMTVPSHKTTIAEEIIGAAGVSLGAGKWSSRV